MKFLPHALLKDRQKVLAFTEHAEKTLDGDYPAGSSLWTWEYWWYFQLCSALKVKIESQELPTCWFCKTRTVFPPAALCLLSGRFTAHRSNKKAIFAII